ncbi:MAG TPA: maleylpyruvate isomerase N-terminal domain-containing protein [Actinomycetota bacterium]|nr:maleylpyruvate isomerase N-terminal domain-containing protein [Actinomycetota bacterium]
MSAVKVDKGEALSAAGDAVERFVALLRTASDPASLAVGTWTAADVACHFAHTLERNVAGAQGLGFPGETIETINLYNDSYLKLDPERDLDVLATKIEHEFAELARVLQDRDGDEIVPWYGDIPVPLTTLPGVMLSESEIHGLDVARSQGMAWRIPRRNANLIFESALPLVPHFVDREAAAGVNAVFQISLRGGSPVRFVFEDGTVEVMAAEAGARRPDVRISADPVDFILVSYGRIGQWGPILKGKIFAWGRKPLLALKLTSMLDAP